jgi:tRNA A-37 threonylcarbamoyl transferase component Bud32
MAEEIICVFEKKIKIRNMTFNILRFFRRITRIPRFLVKYGFLQFLKVMFLFFVVPQLMRIWAVWLRLYTSLKWRAINLFFAGRLLDQWRERKDEVLTAAKTGYKIKTENLGLSEESLKQLLKAQCKSREIVIGQIDHDGFLLSNFDFAPDIPTVSQQYFLTRKRFKLELVAIDGYVGIRKSFKGNKQSFINELRALHLLGLAGCNIPTLMKIDFDNLVLTFSYIAGPVLREELAKKGAILRDRDVDNNPDFMCLQEEQIRIKRIEEGRRILYDVIDHEFVEDLFDQFRKIHESKFIHGVKYGNIIIEKASGKPYLIDFELSSYYPHLCKNSFIILRDKDIEQFNLHFATKKLTYRKMKEKVKKIEPEEVYAPVYFGGGVRLGNIWDMVAGYGRWNYILKDNLPRLSGKRILTLGANNAHNSIQLLRCGAREVIGVELNIDNIQQGNFVLEGFEWADNVKYNFRYCHANMKELPQLNLGEFDMVMALCSIYYLDDDSIKGLVRYVSKITDTFILQCNLAKNIGRSDPNTYTKASLDYTLDVLHQNGFVSNEVIAPVNYTRPLVIGRKTG